MPRTSLAAALCLAAASALAPAAPAAAEPYQTLAVDQVEKMLGQPGVVILDANTPDLWAKHHLPGAVHITGRRLAEVLPQDREARLVFYCSGPK